MARVQTITPFLWFNNQAAKAAKFYVAIFDDSKVLSMSPMHASFRLAGLRFEALNGGPMFKFTPAISLYVSCTNQREVDYYWKRLTAGGGKAGRCGWLTDKFGVSWQVIPTVLGELLSDDDQAKSGRAMQAMLKMKKLDIAKLKQAFEG